MDELARSNVAAPHTEGWVGERRVGSRLVVGIPRALGFHDSAWFWVPFFQSLGISTVLSGRSSAALFDKGMEHVPSESACYPFKLLFGHVVDVLESGADVVFCPMIKPSFFKSLRGGAGDARDPRLDCPLVIDLGGVLGSSALGEKCMISDLRRASTLDDIIEPLHETLLQRGIEFAQSDIAAALQSAYEAYAHAHDALRAENEAILDGFAQGAYPGALVIGHAYHVDSGINHEVNRIISELGYAVIDGNALGLDLDAEGAKSSPWNQNAESLGHLSAALEVRDNLRMPVEPLQVVILSSFGCSIDASTVDLVKRWLNDRGVLSTIIKVDDVEDLAAVRIRLRSLAYANRERSMVSKEGRVD